VTHRFLFLQWFLVTLIFIILGNALNPCLWSLYDGEYFLSSRYFLWIVVIFLRNIRRIDYILFCYTYNCLFRLFKITETWLTNYRASLLAVSQRFFLICLSDTNGDTALIISVYCIINDSLTQLCLNSGSVMCFSLSIILFSDILIIVATWRPNDRLYIFAGCTTFGIVLGPPWWRRSNSFT